LIILKFKVKPQNDKNYFYSLIYSSTQNSRFELKKIKISGIILYYYILIEIQEPVNLEVSIKLHRLHKT